MASIRIENGFITQIVNGKLPMKQVLESNFEPDFLKVNAEMFEWLLTYWQQNYKLPSMELVVTRFPTFQPIELDDDPAEVLQAIKKNSETDRFISDMLKTNRLLEKGELSSAVKFLENRLQFYDENVEQDVFDLSSETDSDKLLELYIKRKTELMQKGYVGVPTGFGRELDLWLNGGSQAGNFYGLLAPLGVGKTWGSLVVAAAALEAGKTPLILALEGTLEKEGYRSLTTVTGISNSLLHTGQASETEIRAALEVLRKKAAKFGGHYYLALHGNRSVYSPSVLRKNALKYKPDIIIVDYLTLMGLAGETKDDWTIYSFISKSLKRLAVSLGIPVWATIQGNRTSNTKELLDADDSSYFNILRDFDAVIGVTKVKGKKYTIRVNGVKGRDQQDPDFKAYYTTNWDSGKVAFQAYITDDETF